MVLLLLTNGSGGDEGLPGARELVLQCNATKKDQGVEEKTWVMEEDCRRMRGGRASSDDISSRQKWVVLVDAACHDARG